MFEITGDDIKELDDEQLRTLITRLSVAELQSAQQPISGVTAGGDQNSPDGGIDVRVETHANDFEGDFIPRVPVGFQVKKPDMGPAAIQDEMAPEGALRPVIAELANAGGAYIIASAQGTTADSFLKKRREAMTSALGDNPSKDDLLVEFYDRTRLANWTNKFPGVVAWVREKTGQGLAGWESIGNWIGSQVSGADSYLVDDEATVIDARAQQRKPFAIIEGLQIIRDELRKPGTSTRLIGVSGVGKTRFVQALFEDEVGDNPLDPSIAIYTDYSEEPTPTAKQLAQSLVETGQRAIFVVDNCNPQTHADLAKICDREASQVSLLTVEYDVRGDEPERTEVFRLSAGSEKTIAEWLKLNFNHVSQVDRDRIAEFSGGNFRVARVLAETLKKGDTFAKLTDGQLFERIFQQRNDTDGQLLRAAEVLSLVYSYEGEATDTESELAKLAALANTDADYLFEASVVIEKREVAQSRGRWRAILPQAIANRLAANAIERIAPARLDAFLAGLTPRLVKSFTRRLGYLHDNPKARELVKRLLKADGPLGDLLSLSDDMLQMLRNLAPVAPEAVLVRIEEAVDGPEGGALLNPKLGGRWQVVELLRAIAYDPDLFDRAVRLMSRFVMAESADENHNSARDTFEGLFQLYLSGTMALPDQRRAIVVELCSNPETKRAGVTALRALLHAGHFSSMANFDFGARSRNFGWEPKTYSEEWDWYAQALHLARVLCSNESIRGQIAPIVAHSARQLLRNEPSFKELEAFTEFMLQQGPWIDGWREVRLAQRFDEDDWPPELQDHVSALEQRLRPLDSASQIQAWVLSGNGFHDLIMAEADDDNSSYDDRYTQARDRARRLGSETEKDRDALLVLLPDLFAAQFGEQVHQFGCGLAEVCTNRAQLWETLLAEFEQLDPNERNVALLGGFIAECHVQSDTLAEQVLDDCLNRESLKPYLVYFQRLVGFSETGLTRIWSAIEGKTIAAHQFAGLACGVIREFPESELPVLLHRISSLEGGVSMALDIFHMAIYCARTDAQTVSDEVLQAGRDILLLCDFRRQGDMREHTIQKSIEYCYENGQPTDQLCALAELVKSRIDEERYRAWEYEGVMSAIFKANTDIGLDVFVLGGDSEGDPIFGLSGPMRGSPVETVEPARLWSWADRDAERRYPLLGRTLQPFPERIAENSTELSSTYLEALERSPDRSDFLAADPHRFGPRGWSGSLAAILDRRREEIGKLANHPDDTVKNWVKERIAVLSERADRERECETEREESFE